MTSIHHYRIHYNTTQNSFTGLKTPYAPPIINRFFKEDFIFLLFIFLRFYLFESLRA